MAKRFGVSEEKVAAIADFQVRPEFTAREKAALAVAEAMTRSGGEVADEVWAALATHFDDGQIIEIVATAAGFNAFNRMANAMQVEVTK